ncbi:MAG: hypothetical protein KGM15_13870 [Pseudomonadota bacterium]|nr:hypothetical protein [Pseudomonadota bacterium]
MVKISLAAVVVLLSAAPVFAQDCAADLQALSSRREAALKNINAMVVSAKGKKLDPEAFCARSRPLNAAEAAMLAYMVKNKDWCQIPDDSIAQLKATHAKSAAFGDKACAVAVQITKMKKQAAQAAQQSAAGGGAPAEQPLPAGPL